MAHDSELGWALGVVFRAWQRETEAAVGDLPHGPRGFQILSTLAVGEPPTQAAIATHLGIDRTVLTYVLDDLAAAGLVERTADARDRRVRRLVLTESGRSRLAALRERMDAVEAGLFPGLSASEAASLRALVERAAAGMHTGDGEHDACRVVEDILADAGRAG
jgi:MarR family transcriptional regulator, transcriptional regulator for hemolysin